MTNKLFKLNTYEFYILMKKMMDESENTENELEIIKNKFFDAIKSESLQDIIHYFRNDKYKVWLFREEDEFTGNFSV